MSQETGDRLRLERERLELGQQAVADACGVTMRTQRNYESGLREPDAAYLRLAAALGIDVTFVLLGITGDAARRLNLHQLAIEIVSMHEDDFEKIRSGTKSLLRLLECWLRCTPQNRDAIVELAARLAQVKC